MFSRLIDHAKGRIEKRRRYNRLVAEIRALSAGDIAELNGDRGEMLRAVYRNVYG